MQTTEITLPVIENTLAVFTASKGLDPYLDEIRAEIDSFIPTIDVSTDKGRKEVSSMAYKVSRIKSALDGMGKDLVDDLKEKPKLIDAERKRMRDTLDSWRDEVRQPLTEYENAEKARKQAHEDNLQAIRRLCDGLADADSSMIQERINQAEAIELGAHWQEFEINAARLKDETLQVLKTALTARIEREKELAELELLRKKQAEQEQKEREERIAREAADAARRQAEEALRRKGLEQQLQLERAEREKQEAIARAERAAELERQKIAYEQQQAEAAEAKRKADTEHQRAVNTNAADAFIQAGFSEEQARKIVCLIVKGSVPNVSIRY